MVAHKISSTLLDSLIASPSPTKTTQVANMQNYIQDLLGDTHFTFLQGSYKNDTAVSDINDVDIVAVRQNTYSTIHSGRTFPVSVYWETIFSEIEQKLRNQQLYTWTVTRGDKCIKIRGAFNADVVPTVKVNEDHLTDPVVVYSFRTGVEKLNHPRVHYQNGVTKSASTEQRYKPAVRMFKNWVRNHFGEDKATVSSFKMEALVHGAADNLFYADPAATFIMVGANISDKLTARSLLPKAIHSVCGGEDITSEWGYADRDRFHKQLEHSLQHAGHAYSATSQEEADRLWRLAFNL